jgi:hypothetical protein
LKKAGESRFSKNKSNGLDALGSVEIIETEKSYTSPLKE